ncbi:MAG: hypothetical protein EXR74_10200 [Bdellovibrionales bacterium]|nr:hypothetical protein [Bdellovibrionales bacterium]
MKTKFINLMVVNLIMLIGTGCTSSKLGDVVLDPNNNTRNGITTIQSVSPAPLVFSSLVKSLLNSADIIDPAKINLIYAEYNLQKNQLPQLGDAGEINTAAVGAIIVIAGQVCGALKDKELAPASVKKAFVGFKFQAVATEVTIASLAPDSVVKDAGSSLIKMFLGRIASESERGSFVLARDRSFLGQTITSTNNRKLVSDLAVILCTGVASSLEAISM